MLNVALELKINSSCLSANMLLSIGKIYPPLEFMGSRKVRQESYLIDEESFDAIKKNLNRALEASEEFRLFRPDQVSACQIYIGLALSDLETVYCAEEEEDE